MKALADHCFLLFIVGLVGFLLGLLVSLRKDNRLIDAAHEELTSDQTWVRAAALGSSLDAISIADPDGVLRYVNDSFLRVFGYDTLEEVLAMSAGEFWADPAKSTIVATTMVENGSYQGETEGRHRDGHVISLRLSANIINNPGSDTPIAWMASMQDITTLKEAETQLQQAQKMEAVGHLTGGVAHDFNNLLMSMQLNLEFLSDEVGESAEGQGYIERISHAVEQGASLTQQLLAFSRLQVLKMEAVDVNGLIERQISLLGRALPEDIETDLEMAGDLWRARADSMQLESAILNLAINARDAMPSGGVLAISTENVTLDETATAEWETPAVGDYVCLSISDNGVGMTEDVKAQAVEPFFMTKDVGAGSGLGLSMAYGFVAQSGGQLIIETAPGVGTTIRLYFKRAEDAAQPADADKPGAAVGGIETILVVEDDADVRNAVVRGLNNMGYVVFSAETGPRAVDWVKAYESEIDLVLTDMVMPEGMNGREVADVILQQHPETKVLFMSGYTDAEVRVGGQLRSGSDYIQKPFTMKALTSLIRNILDAS